MEFRISQDRNDESIEAKARWFQSLTIQERAALLSAYTDMILSINPKIVEKKRAQPIEGRIQVLRG